MADAKGKRTINALLSELNPIQKEAVSTTAGPVLILAGAGSGKTRVLTYRVAYLIASGLAKPWEILAVTFTNKAANEMRERILALAHGVGRDSWIGTFHAICARILRVDGDRIGYARNFSVFDREDQLRFIRGVMDELNISSTQYAPEAILRAIGSAKNMFVSPAEFADTARDPVAEKAAAVYRRYQERMLDNNVMDFDDLLVNPLHLFQSDHIVLEKYQDRFKYILVDEYQDTNRTQYLFLKYLARKYRNLCVVGDDDQSIYRWRGADIQNILNVEKDYPECRIFRLEQNYRSTKNILEVANSVVKKNINRHPKALWTDRERGEQVHVSDLDDQIAEALFIVGSIREELHKNGRNFSDFAVLFRTNVQSRVLEEALRNAGTPYIIVGGVRFYERKEIKDILAYLRLICNPRDSISFKRVINFPLRGIGDASVAKLEEYAEERHLSLFEAAGKVREISRIADRIAANIEIFYQLITKYSSLKDEFSAAELARALVDEIGVLRTFKEVGTEEALGRAENVRELLSAVANNHDAQPVTLEEFLADVALISDIDSWDDRANAVTLMTLHSAKGLEFPVVYISGLEEGLFPLTRTFETEEELEEERRLFYVGITRAEAKLTLTWAHRRLRFGEYYNNLPSRFIEEIDASLLLRVKRQSFRQRRQDSRNTSHYDYDNVDVMPDYEDFSQEVAPALGVGMRVRHRKFGVGKIISTEGNGENQKLTVRFISAGDKKLVARYANLETLT
jgi:DNA helicase-2/ATP-dependent DNA helicase PcrA